MIYNLAKKKLKSYLSKLVNCKKKSIDNIPDLIDNTERIIRVIFSRMNLKGNSKLKPNAFKSPPDIDEVSTIRIDHSSADFCKQHGKSIQNPQADRSYFGLAALNAIEIRNIGAEVISSKKHFPSHSDIKIGYIIRRGEPLPSEYNLMIKQLAKEARLYEDSNMESDKWEGNNPT